MSQFVNEQGQPVTKEQLKILALRERVANLTAEYEDKIADLRVELTVTAQENEQLKKQLQGEGDEAQDAAPTEEGWPHNVG
jgi:hypothetical protein